MKNIILRISCALFVIGASAQTESQSKKIVANYDLAKSEALVTTFEKEHLERSGRINTYLNKLNEQELSTIDKWNLFDISPEGIPVFYENHNNTAAVSISADDLYAGGSLGLNLTGNGLVAGVWEAFQVQGSYPLINHVDFDGRVSIIDFGLLASLHGTHVAGTIMSSGASTSGNLGRGIAYEANVIAANVDNNFTEMTEQAANGLLVSNHSYGLNPAGLPLYRLGAYDNNSRSVDLILEAHPYYLPVYSAGNDRDSAADINPTKNGYDLLNGPGTAKNAITSAAVARVSNYTGPFSVTMSSFSNYGPADDGRIKPDISSQGVAVLSTSNDSSNTGYATLQGTSMSAPSITGLLLLLQEHYNNVNSNFMLAATAKGLLLHTADEAGFNQGPDYSFGWGLANGKKAVETITKSSVGNSFIEETTLVNTNSRAINVIASGNEPLMVSISWTDPAGFPPGDSVDNRTPVLINDLDLKLSKDGINYFPWKLDPVIPALGASRYSSNDVDNFEKVEVDAPVSNAIYEVLINHKGTLDGGSQNYSLVITGGTLESLSTDDNTISNSLKIYPNPNNGKFSISFDTGLNSGKDVSINLTDISGRQVFKANFKGSSQIFSQTIDVNHIQPGVYIANITQGSNTTSQKIIIE